MHFSEDLRLHGLLNYFWILSSLSPGIFQPLLFRSKEYYNLYNSIALHKYHWGVAGSHSDANSLQMAKDFNGNHSLEVLSVLGEATA